MEKKKVLKIVTEDQLKIVTKSGLNWVRISFPTEQNPIYIVLTRNLQRKKYVVCLKVTLI